MSYGKCPSCAQLVRKVIATPIIIDPPGPKQFRAYTLSCNECGTVLTIYRSPPTSVGPSAKQVMAAVPTQLVNKSDI